MKLKRLIPSKLGTDVGRWWSSRCLSFGRILVCPVMVMAVVALAAPARAAGRIDASTLIMVPHGTFSGVKYTRYEAMFAGVTANNRPYRVPCQIIAPSTPGQGSGLLLF